MGHNILGSVVAFIIGVAVSFLNYLISRTVLQKKSQMYSSISSIRMIINLVFLITVYFASSPLGFDSTYCLIGGGLGLTISLFCFTPMLLKQSRKLTDGTASEERQENQNEKERTDD